MKIDFFTRFGADGRGRPGVAGAATEHPLERVESNDVRTKGKPPPPLNKNIFPKRKKTYFLFNCHNMTFKEYIFELQKKDPQFQACLRAGA